MINYFENRRSNKMRKDYFAKIVKYVKNVYNIEGEFRNLKMKE